MTVDIAEREQCRSSRSHHAGRRPGPAGEPGHGDSGQGLDVTRTTVLPLDTTPAPGGIRNIPFIVAQAEAVALKATFWVQELAPTDPSGQPTLQLQYLQVVMLDFFPRTDGRPGRIGWPHVSINTLQKVADSAAPA